MLKTENESIKIMGLFICLLAALFFLYEFFLRAFLNTLVPEISSSFKIDPEQLSLLAAAYYLTYGIMQIPVGILVDRFGVRLLLTLATIVAGMGVFLFAITNTFLTAVISRLLMGFGSSFGFICLLVLTLNWLPRRYTGFFFGVAQFLGTLGPMLAGAPFAILLYKLHDNWRIVLTFIGIVALMLALFIGLFVRDKPKHLEKRFIFLSRSESLLKRLTLLIKNSQVWLLVLYSPAVYVSVALLGALWGTTYLETRGISKELATFITSLLWLGLAFGCPILGFISDTIRRRKPILIINSLIGLSASLAIIYWPSNNPIFFIPLFFVLGIAGAGQSIGFATIAEHVEIKLHAAALGFNNSCITLTSAIVLPLIGLIIKISAKGHIVKGVLIYQRHDFNLAFTLLPVFFLIGFIIAFFFIKETYCRQQKEPLKLQIKD
jgi:MFS family permease